MIGGKAGVIVINKKGRFTILHSTKYMASGYANSKGIVVKEGFPMFSKNIEKNSISRNEK